MIAIFLKSPHVTDEFEKALQLSSLIEFSYPSNFLADSSKIESNPERKPFIIDPTSDEHVL